MRRAAIFSLILAAATLAAFGQGGAPMLTDDPGTPGSGHWENNFAFVFAHRPNEWSGNGPIIDLNYGWGDHVQLTVQAAAAFRKRGEGGLLGGLGVMEAAVKWRFLDRQISGVDLSTCPRIFLNALHASVRRGLADDGTRFQIPFQIAKGFGRFYLDFEFGPLVNSAAPAEFLYGAVGGCELTKRTSLMAEIHATSRTNFTRELITLNCGWRHRLTEHANWIASLGHEVHSDADEPLALIGYCGLQLYY